jgi:hypothetical protein
MGHAAVFCNERSSTFLFGILQDLELRSRGLLHYILSKCLEFRVLSKIKAMLMTQDRIFSVFPNLRLRN